MEPTVGTAWKRKGKEWWTLVITDAVLFTILILVIVLLLVWIYLT